MKKNDVVRLKIDDIGVNGEGIGKVDGYTLFVKDTVIGDFIEAKIMKAKKSYGYARLMQILEASPDRVEAKCPVARQCGGCQIQQMSYEKQLAFKERKVRESGAYRWICAGIAPGGYGADLRDGGAVSLSE